MNAMSKALGGLAVSAALLLGGCAATTEVKNTWRAHDDARTPIGKLAVLVLDADDSLRRYMEDQTVRSLPVSTKATAAYSLFDKPEGDVGKLKEKLVSQGFDALLITRTVSVDKTKTQVPASTQLVPAGPMLLPTTRQSTDGKTLETYYTHTFGYTYQTTPGYTATYTTVSRETVLYRLPKGEAVWSAVTESVSGRSKVDMAQDLINLIEKEMAKEGLIAGKAK